MSKPQETGITLSIFTLFYHPYYFTYYNPTLLGWRWAPQTLLVGWGEGLLADIYPKIPRAPVLTGVIAFLLSAFGGMLALQYRQIATETYRTIRVHFTLARGKKSISTLLDLRGRLFDDFMELDRRLMSKPQSGSGTSTQ